ncbi:MAG: 16S rRNA (adenine(1518)-N(6)/adenine(1519)-N(6))-dimethyltransferase RsmA [Candidatus Peribacteraceae bacterium]
MLRQEVQSFLAGHGIRLSTDLGQHFLVSDDALEAIVETANVNNRDKVIEIGPGIGILTRELVHRAEHVTAVEIDPRFPPLLKEFTEHPKNLDIIQGNALHSTLPTEDPYKIVANIPYHITSPLLHRFLMEEKRRPTSMTLLIQREVAENIVSDGTESVLTLLVQLFGHPSLVLQVPPAAFLPPPKVDSAVLHIDLYDEPKASRSVMEKALTLLKHAGRERRKMLRNTIGSLPGGMDALSSLNIEPTRRPQTLTVDEWVALATVFLSAA